MMRSACDTAVMSSRDDIDQAKALLRQKDVAGAEAACDRLLRAAPDRPDALALLAVIRALQGRIDEADALFTRALERDPAMAEAYANRARLRLRLGPVD